MLWISGYLVHKWHDGVFDADQPFSAAMTSGKTNEQFSRITIFYSDVYIVPPAVVCAAGDFCSGASSVKGRNIHAAVPGKHLLPV